MTSLNKERRTWSRGSFLRVAAGTGGAVLGGALVGRRVAVSDAAPSPAQDRRIFQFALVLEELQAAFYSEALNRGGLHGDLHEFATVVGAHERAHVAFLRKSLGGAALPPRTFHFGDATSNPERFGAAAHEIENIGVAAYNGQGAKLTAGAMEHAAEIVSVEGRHAGWIGALLRDPPAPRAADPGLDANAVLAQLKARGYLA
ncbi:MAG: ferritin-like domain-containing protein [Solirubrobacteraceae bacterium]